MILPNQSTMINHQDVISETNPQCAANIHFFLEIHNIFPEKKMTKYMNICSIFAGVLK